MLRIVVQLLVPLVAELVGRRHVMHRDDTVKILDQVADAQVDTRTVAIELEQVLGSSGNIWQVDSQIAAIARHRIDHFPAFVPQVN